MTDRDPADVQDIVERLGWHHEHPVTGKLVLRNLDGREAADEIERLRAAQAAMRHLLLEAVLAAGIHREGGNWDAVMPMEEWLDKSRRALSQESAHEG